MLHDSWNLRTCEAALRPGFTNAPTVAKAAILTPRDLDLLTTGIRHKITQSPRTGIADMEAHYPCSFVSFMVWKAKTTYREGLFWPPILESLGLSGAQWEQALGQTFQRCLAKLELPQYDLPGALTYVTPVLSHGGIPDSCANSFFRGVVEPFVKDGIVNPDFIKYELEILREEDALYREHEAEENDLRKRVENTGGMLKGLQELHNKLTFLLDIVDKHGFGNDFSMTFALLKLQEENAKRAERALELREQQSRLIRVRQDAVGAITQYIPEKRRLVRVSKQIMNLASLYPKLEKLKQRCLQQKNLLAQIQGELVTTSRSDLGVLWDERLHNSLKHPGFSDKLEGVLKERDRAFRALIEKGYVEVSPGSEGQPRRYLFKPPYSGKIQRLLTGITLFSAVGTLTFGFSSQEWLRFCFPFMAGIALLSGLWLLKVKKEMRGYCDAREAFESSLDALEGLGLSPVSTEQPANLKAFDEILGFLEAYENALVAIETTKERIFAISDEIDRELAACPTLYPLLKGDPVCLEQALKYAEASRKKAVESLNTIRNDVDPNLKKILLQRLSLILHSAVFTAKVKEFGRGDLGEGLKRLKEAGDDLEKAWGIKRSLGGRKIPSGELGLNSNDLAKDIEAIRERIHATERSLESFKDKLAKAREHKKKYLPAFSPRVEEPVARYMLYGGDSSAEFLQESVRLYMDSKGTKAVDDANTTAACKLARRTYQMWRSGLDEKEPRKITPGLGIIDKEPEIIFEESTCRLFLRIPEQRVDLENLRRVVLRICYEPLEVTEEHHLTVFKEDENWGRINRTQLPLSYPCDVLTVGIVGLGVLSDTLEGADSLRWTLEPPGPGKPLTFFKPGGTEIKDKLPRGVFWAVSAPSFRPPQGAALIAHNTMYGEWATYHAFCLDASDSQADGLQFQSSEGHKLEFLFQEVSLTQEPRLYGDKTRALLDGLPVYTGDMPSLFIDFGNTQELSYWRFQLTRKAVGVGDASGVTSLAFDLESLLYPVSSCGTSEVAATSVQDLTERLPGFVKVPLKFPETQPLEPVALYNLRLIGPRRRRYTFDFWVADIDGEFEPILVGPCAGEEETISLGLILPEDTELHPRSPVEVVHMELGYASLRFGSGLRVVEGTLWCQGRELCTVSIPVSRIFAQLLIDGNPQFPGVQSSVNEIDIRKLSEGEQPRLCLRFHHFENMAQDATLVLEGTSQFLTKKVEKDKVEFDVSQFLDTLRGLDSLGLFCVNVRSRSGEVLRFLPVLRVYTRWAVKRVNLTTRVGGGMIQMDLGWEQTGSAEYPVVRIAPLQGGEVDFLEVEIPRGESRISFEFDAASCALGPHYIKFADQDPWAVSSASFEDKKNLFVADISPSNTRLPFLSLDWETGEVRGLEGGHEASIYCLSMDQDEASSLLGLQELSKVGAKIPRKALEQAVAIAVLWEGAGIIEINPQLAAILLPATRDAVLLALEYLEARLPVAVELVPVPTGKSIVAVPSRASPSNNLGGAFAIEGQSALKLLHSALEGKEAGLKIWFPEGEEIVSVRLNPEGSGWMGMPRGVRCNSCGRLFLTQAQWHAHSPRCSGGGKSLHVNIERAWLQAYIRLGHSLTTPKSRPTSWGTVSLAGNKVLPASQIHVDHLKWRESLVAARWCTPKSGEKWMKLLHKGSVKNLLRELLKGYLNKRRESSWH